MKQRRYKNLFSTFLCWTGVVSVIALTGATRANGDITQTAMPEKLEINIQATCPDRNDLPADRKRIANFSHRLHADKYLNGQSKFASLPFTDEFTCSACHSGAQSKKELEQADRCQRIDSVIENWGGGKNYKQNMHMICLKCHKNMKEANIISGPTSCKQCHGK